MLSRRSRVLLPLAAAALLSIVAVGPLTAQQQPRNNPRDGLLDEEQINAIKQVELQPADARGRQPRIRFDNRVVQRYVEANGLDFREFNNQPDLAKALTIIEAGDEDMVKDVRIITDPAAIAVFKDAIHPAVLQGCATSACHGSNDEARNAGLRLYNDGRGDDVVYTNFFNLSSYKVKVANPTGNAFGGPETVGRKLIDRATPQTSLLLEYMIPATAATTPHPKVDDEDLRPRFTDPTDQGYVQLRNWLINILERNTGGYGEEENGNATQPAEDGADAPGN